GVVLHPAILDFGDFILAEGVVDIHYCCMDLHSLITATFLTGERKITPQKNRLITGDFLAKKTR
ncbi:MAG: hypothetical protein ACYSR3_02140, partial [Planctomycetota bacterium]